MTEERAIELLEKIKRGSIATVHLAESREAIEMAIMALERRVPKEPEKVEGHLYCPVCDGFIGYDIECKEEHYQIPHCQGCGQAIDWGEIDD